MCITWLRLSGMQGRILSNKYRLLRQLGRGGMGSVWEAEQLNLPIGVAVKLLDPARSHSAELRERFKREAHAAAQLRSTHIVRISDYGIDDELPYIVMELLEGESLAARLARKGRLSPRETVRIFSHVAAALELAHRHGVVHRDLKPENVFIQGYCPATRAYTDLEQTKVLDFGVAKLLVDKPWHNGIRTRTGQFLGTPVYMSPEQIRDSSHVDERTDIWSFGVMAYECMTGRRPFQAKNLVDLQFSICHDDVTPPSQVASVPELFDAWFARAACRDLNERFATIAASMDRLRQALDDGATYSDERQGHAVEVSDDAFVNTTEVDADRDDRATSSDVERSAALSRELAGVTTVESVRKAKARVLRRRMGISILLVAGLVAAEHMRSVTRDSRPEVVRDGSVYAVRSAVPLAAVTPSESAPCFVPYDSIPIVAASALPLEMASTVVRSGASATNLKRPSAAAAATAVAKEPAADPTEHHHAEVEPDYGLY